MQEKVKWFWGNNTGWCVVDVCLRGLRVCMWYECVKGEEMWVGKRQEAIGRAGGGVLACMARLLGGRRGSFCVESKGEEPECGEG